MKRILDLRQQLLELARRHASGLISQADHDRNRTALERELVDLVLADEAQWRHSNARAWIPAGLGIAAILLAALWWSAARTGGSPGIVAGPPGAPAESNQAPSQPEPPMDQARMAAMTEKLADRLKRQPDNAPGWAMLARSHALLEQPAQAAEAYAKAVALQPDNPTWLAEYAQVRAALKGGPFGPEESAMVAKALKLEPDNLKGLWLAGAMAFERHDYAGAVKLWEKMLQIGPIEDLDVVRLQSGIAEARKRAQLGAVALVVPASAPVP